MLSKEEAMKRIL